jgi:hypothetical protein
MAWIGQIDEDAKRRQRILAAAEEMAGIQKPFVRCNLENPPPREGYVHRDGEKGIGYYLATLKRKVKAEEALYSTNCADGPLMLTHAEVQVLTQMNLPVVALPAATVKSIVATAMKAVEAGQGAETKLDEIKEDEEEEQQVEEVPSEPAEGSK